MIYKRFYSRLYWFWVLMIAATMAPTVSFGQCNALSSRRDIFFTPTFGCAPTSVTRFEITYYFTLPQNPAGIQIRYQWNDPANTVDIIDVGSGLVVGGGNTSFSANSTFTYNTNNGQCSIRPQVSIIVNGVDCPTSTQMQTAPYWGTDDQANGIVAMAPATWDVCFDNPVINATFRDASNFNCNIAVEADNPNRLTRHVQFVYGTNNSAATSIRDLTLTDAGIHPLTGPTGALVAPITRGTGPTVTAAYFGPVDALPFPADNPTSVSFPMNAPANVANLIGNEFEVTMFNWNVCNPWNNDPLNPNYSEARVTRGYIRIVAAPLPAFDTRDSGGNPKTNFCIGEDIYFKNLTPNINAYGYSWKFFDDAVGTTVLGTSTQRNPVFQYPSGGVKLIRLTATNPTAQGSCNADFDLTVNIVPTVVAKIQMTDLSDAPITPYFCQQPGPPLTTFNVRFHDVSTGTAVATSQWRWEFRDETNTLYREEPGPGPLNFSATPLGPFDIPFTNPGIYHTKLITRDLTTGCTTDDVAEVRVYQKPDVKFTASPVCFGDSTVFNEASTFVSINGESIVSKEWDFNYNGMTFNPDPAFTNKTSFKRLLGSAGTYQVALRVTMDQAACEQTLILPVVVHPLPLATFISDVNSGCSVLTVKFTNTSLATQPDVVSSYIWEIDDGLGGGFLPILTQHPTDPGFDGTFTRNFRNVSVGSVQFKVRLHTVTVNTCEALSAPQIITVFPGTASGFIALNYSPFNDNCSPQNVNFAVDGATQSLNPTDYKWVVSDASGVISSVSTGTTPTYSYSFSNTTPSIKDYQITLTTKLASNCFGDSTKTIRISPLPTSDFTIDTLSFDCLKMRLRMTATQPGLVDYQWQILENGVPVFGSSGVADTLGYLFDRPSAGSPDINVQITLITKNFANCSSPKTAHDIVLPPQDNSVASFSATPLSQTLPNSTITITNSSVGTGTYAWDFGDSTTSSTTASSFTHTYATYGNYIIKLTITNGLCVHSTTGSVNILAVPPVVDFAYDPPLGCIPLTVTFTNLSKFADPSTFLWDFGDGIGVSKQVNPVYTYFNPGKYTVKLSASNITGQVVTMTKPLIIQANPKPAAGFKVRPEVLIIPGDIMYTANLSVGADSYQWDFGDGETSIDPQPQHLYKEEGEFTITLIASNDFGCTDTSRMISAVKVVKGGEILVPNGFTPNVSDGNVSSNGRNDVFLPIARNVKKFELLIFNRWGQLLFESQDQTIGWDGTYNGKLCQQDVYAYKLTTTSDNDVTLVRLGDVNLIR